MAYKPLSSINSSLFPKTATTAAAGNSMSSTTPMINSYQPMGTPAKSPQTNIATPTNTAPPSQLNTQPPKADTGIATPPPQAATNPNPFPGLVGQIANIGQNGTPEYAQANKELLDFKKNYQNYQSAVGSESNPFGFMTGVGQLAGNRYASLLPAYEQNVANTLAQGNQRLSALGTAAGAASPTQVSPGNFYVSPVTGGDVSGGSITPGAGGARITQVTQGQNAQANLPIINSAANFVNNVNNLLSKGGFNQSDLNAYNLLHNIAASNVSNPAYPQLQSNFNNAVNFYAQVLGQDPNTLISTLASTGKANTVSEALKNLDSMARQYNQRLYSASRGDTSTNTIQPVQQSSPVPNSQGQTTGGNSWTVTQT